MRAPEVSSTWQEFQAGPVTEVYEREQPPSPPQRHRETVSPREPFYLKTHSLEALNAEKSVSVSGCDRRGTRELHPTCRNRIPSAPCRLGAKHTRSKRSTTSHSFQPAPHASEPRP